MTIIGLMPLNQSLLTTRTIFGLQMMILSMLWKRNLIKTVKKETSMNKMKMIKKDNHKKTNKKRWRKIKWTLLNSRNSLLLEDNRMKIGDQVNMKNSVLVYVSLLTGNPFLLEEVMTFYYALEKKGNNGNNSIG